MEYLSGDINEITLIQKEVSVEKDEKVLAGLYLIEFIPKEISTNVSEIGFLFEYNVIKEDPIIKIDMPIDKYAYYINKRIGLDKIKNTKSIIISKEVVKTNPILGFAVFDNLPATTSSTAC